jgi:hypothetical protein
MQVRWRTAGHATEPRIRPETAHAFLSLAMTIADVARSAEHNFLAVRWEWFSRPPSRTRRRCHDDHQVFN